MSSQPLNSSISVYRAVRAYRNIRRHTSVQAIIDRLYPLIMSVPSEEIISGVLTRDTTKEDFSAYARDGQPVVIGLFPTVLFSHAQEEIPNVDFSFQVGSDRFLTNTQAGLAGDIQNDLRNVT